MNGNFPGGFPARESMPDSVNMDNENNGSRKKVGQKLVTSQEENPGAVEK